MTSKTGHGTAVVTGASSGIGAVYAERLADRGYDLVLVARRRAELEALAARIAERTGRKVDVLVADLAKPKGRPWSSAGCATTQPITLLINNAGSAATGPLVGGNADATEKMLAINIVALTRLSAAAANAFADRKAGTIINISSAMAVITSAQGRRLQRLQGLRAELHARACRRACDRMAFACRRCFRATHARRSSPTRCSATIPPETIMPVEELVDAALAGLDHGETVTIPSLPDTADWDALRGCPAQADAEHLPRPPCRALSDPAGGLGRLTNFAIRPHETPEKSPSMSRLGAVARRPREWAPGPG